MTAPNKFSIRRIRDYAKAFDLSAICIDTDGRAHLSTSPSGFSFIAWASTNDALRIARWINQPRHSGKPPPSIEAAARARNVTIISHDELVRSATEAASAIDRAMLAAQRLGALTPINAGFAQHALHANGQRGLSYSRTIARVRILMFEAVARSEPLPLIPDVVRMVLLQRAESEGNCGP